MPVRDHKRAETTREAIANFEAAIAEAKKRHIPEGTDPTIWEAYQAGMVSQLDSLKRELAGLIIEWCGPGDSNP